MNTDGVKREVDKLMRCEWTCEMQTRSPNSDLFMDVSDRNSAVPEMQEVLSLHLPSFYRCALRLLGNAADAEDAVQEALLAAYRHIDQIRGQAHLTTWLTTIVRNCPSNGRYGSHFSGRDARTLPQHRTHSGLSRGL